VAGQSIAAELTARIYVCRVDKEYGLTIRILFVGTKQRGFHGTVSLRRLPDYYSCSDASGSAAAGHAETETGTEIPLSLKVSLKPTGTDAPEQAEAPDAVPAEPAFTPNVEEYLNLKSQHPDKSIGVQVGD